MMSQIRPFQKLDVLVPYNIRTHEWNEYQFGITHTIYMIVTDSGIYLTHYRPDPDELVDIIVMYGPDATMVCRHDGCLSQSWCVETGDCSHDQCSEYDGCQLPWPRLGEHCGHAPCFSLLVCLESTRPKRRVFRDPEYSEGDGSTTESAPPSPDHDTIPDEDNEQAFEERENLPPTSIPAESPSSSSSKGTAAPALVGSLSSSSSSATAALDQSSISTRTSLPRVLEERAVGRAEDPLELGDGHDNSSGAALGAADRPIPLGEPDHNGVDSDSANTFVNTIGGHGSCDVKGKRKATAMEEQPPQAPGVRPVSGIRMTGLSIDSQSDAAHLISEYLDMVGSKAGRHSQLAREKMRRRVALHRRNVVEQGSTSLSCLSDMDLDDQYHACKDEIYDDLDLWHCATESEELSRSRRPKRRIAAWVEEEEELKRAGKRRA
ncbi:hypothetical protein B0O80DRAFT_476078 [Mortierella sp. GBAus27b]|nr:hypothetical protein B0O80DRAFT_476078 [Mortierella sp. GBAus27b]